MEAAFSSMKLLLAGSPASETETVVNNFHLRTPSKKVTNTVSVTTERDRLAEDFHGSVDCLAMPALGEFSVQGVKEFFSWLFAVGPGSYSNSSGCYSHAQLPECLGVSC